MNVFQLTTAHDHEIAMVHECNDGELTEGMLTANLMFATLEGAIEFVKQEFRDELEANFEITFDEKEHTLTWSASQTANEFVIQTCYDAGYEVSPEEWMRYRITSRPLRA